jgi:hypothetical protein
MPVSSSISSATSKEKDSSLLGETESVPAPSGIGIDIETSECNE